MPDMSNDISKPERAVLAVRNAELSAEFEWTEVRERESGNTLLVALAEAPMDLQVTPTDSQLSDALKSQDYYNFPPSGEEDYGPIGPEIYSSDSSPVIELVSSDVLIYCPSQEDVEPYYGRMSKSLLAERCTLPDGDEIDTSRL